MKLQKISLREKLDSFDRLYDPQTVATVNEFAMKLVKVDGEFVWHRHDEDDELFLVLRGTIHMHYRNGDAEDVETFGAGELLRVPRGMEHKPVAEPGTEIALFERADLVNTGNVYDARFTRSADGGKP